MLDWLKELLTQLGLTVSDEDFEKITEAAPDHVVAKKDYDEIQTSAATKSDGSDSDLQQQLDTLQKKYEDDTSGLQDQLAQVKFDSALDLALAGSKAKNAKAVKALLQADNLQLADDGSLEGLEEQLKGLKESDAYLFADDSATFRGTEPAGKSDPAPTPVTMSEAIAEKIAEQTK